VGEQKISTSAVILFSILGALQSIQRVLSVKLSLSLLEIFFRSTFSADSLYRHLLKRTTKRLVHSRWTQQYAQCGIRERQTTW